MRSEKADKFKELKKKRNSEEFEYWFLRYNPGGSLEVKPEALPLPKEEEKTKTKRSTQRKRKRRENRLYG